MLKLLTPYTEGAIMNLEVAYANGEVEHFA